MHIANRNAPSNQSEFNSRLESLALLSVWVVSLKLKVQWELKNSQEQLEERTKKCQLEDEEELSPPKRADSSECCEAIYNKNSPSS